MIFHVLLTLTLQLPTAAERPTAVVNIPRVVAESTIGKAATAQLRELQAEKQKAITDKQAEVQRLNQAHALPAQIGKARLELERLTQDAEVDLAALDRQLQAEFNRKLQPVVAQVAEEEHIGILFEYPSPLIVWVAPAIDVTSTVIAHLDAASKDKK
jgi:Skp family chaperone for outer membrane proteins